MTKQLIDNDGKRIINNNNRQRSQSIHPSPTPRISLSSNKIIRSEKDDKRNDNQLIDQQAAIILNDDHHNPN